MTTPANDGEDRYWMVVRICKTYDYLSGMTHKDLTLKEARTLAVDLSNHPGVDGKGCCSFHPAALKGGGFVIDGKPYP